MSISNVTADNVESDVTIDPGEEESDLLVFTRSGDKVEISVTSDVPVNVYIMKSGDYYPYSSGNDFSEAKHSVLGTTSTKFAYKIPDD